MKVNSAIYNSVRSKKPINVQQGGTSSGKTYGIIQYLFEEGARHNKETITVVADDVPNLKSGAYRDAQEILSTDEVLRAWWPMNRRFWNKSERLFTSLSGSQIEFKSFQDEYDARSGKRQRLFINEANAIPFGVYGQLNMRTTKQTIIDFNPSARFWAHERLYGLDEVEWNVTTFRDNAFLNDSIRDKILSYEPTPHNIKRGTANEYRWRVYGLGQVGKLEGLVYPDFKVVTSSEFSTEYKWRVFGLDFGFTNDPTALIEIRYAHGELWWKQHIYETGLTNPDISDKLKQLGFESTQKIVADSAEPKSIKELRNLGWWVTGAKKGRDSVMHGINVVKSYPINILHSSKDLVTEFNSYQWEKDRDGEWSNKPIDNFNHLLDAGRYALSDKVLVDDSSLGAVKANI